MEEEEKAEVKKAAIAKAELILNMTTVTSNSTLYVGKTKKFTYTLPADVTSAVANKYLS